MEYIASVVSPEDILARWNANAPHQRTPGLHLSDIIKSYMREIDPKRFSSTEIDMVRAEAGFAYERVQEVGLSAGDPNLMRPGELVCDGVIGSPDGLYMGTPFTWGDVEYVADADVEYKHTWMSIANGILDRRFWHWFLQVKGYMYMENRMGLDVHDAILYGSFANGHYKWEPHIVPGFEHYGPLPPGPLMLKWHFRFTDQELLMNWASLLKHARRKGLWSPQ